MATRKFSMAQQCLPGFETELELESRLEHDVNDHDDPKHKRILIDGILSSETALRKLSHLMLSIVAQNLAASRGKKFFRQREVANFIFNETEKGFMSSIIYIFSLTNAPTTFDYFYEMAELNKSISIEYFKQRLIKKYPKRYFKSTLEIIKVSLGTDIYQQARQTLALFGYRA